jgi:hypothetical protein
MQCQPASRRGGTLRRESQRLPSSVSLQLATSPMMVFPIGVELPNVMTVQCLHDAEAGQPRKGLHVHQEMSAVSMMRLSA